MILKKWEDLPDFMKIQEVKSYYDSLKSKTIQLIIKRLFDIVASLVLMILFFPIMIIIGLLIKLDSKGPILYKQERVTQYGKIFLIKKLRTMYVNSDEKQLITISDDSRITRIGRILRKTRIDEIPQLLNVFIGEMTFVGTRPEIKKYVDEYSSEMKATLLLPAGITSLASIYYKDENKLIDKDDVDNSYINIVLKSKMAINLTEILNFSIISDFTTMMKTVISMIFN